jgi:hypothetical protein
MFRIYSLVIRSYCCYHLICFQNVGPLLEADRGGNLIADGLTDDIEKLCFHIISLRPSHMNIAYISVNPEHELFLRMSIKSIHTGSALCLQCIKTDLS